MSVLLMSLRAINTRTILEYIVANIQNTENIIISGYSQYEAYIKYILNIRSITSTFWRMTSSFQDELLVVSLPEFEVDGVKDH